MATKCPSALLNPTEEVVISGVSCRLPESNNMEEFARNLFEGIDMTTDDDRRWTRGLYGLPSRTGKVNNLERFDATFFGVHAKQADRMDPALRLLLELSFEAILDSGTNPVEIRGSKTGVFIGYTGSESEEAWTLDPDGVNGYEKTGCHGAMFANRISYSFDLKGPSFTMESKCTSGMLALEQAVVSIRLGKCDAALVGGVNLLLKPQNSIKIQQKGFLAADGKTKVFDSAGDGYAVSEGAVVVFLQKQTKSRRSYASIVHIKSNMDGFKEDGITFPSSDMKKELFEEMYSQAGVNPWDVTYIETNGIGIKSDDAIELDAMAAIFNEGRDPSRPMLIGALKSNMGHTDAASGLCGVVKVLLAIHRSVIPKNVTATKPKAEIDGLIDGRFKVVSENTPWEGGYAGINSFSCFGSNVHVILRGTKSKGSTLRKHSESTVPVLIPFSGSTKAAVEYGLGCLSEVAGDSNFVALLHQVFRCSVKGHPFRGFGIYSDKASQVPLQEVLHMSNKVQPIWFIFSGMGTQWNGMGRDLMNFQVFKNSITKSASFLAKEGINLLHLLLNENDSLAEEALKEQDPVKEALNSFVCITSIQIALVDLLHELGIYPDGLIGHSVGETACAYADGCFTAEQTIMAALVRGKALLEMNTPPGAMAAVGMTWDEAKSRCPNDVFPACHNAHDSVTISGPVDSINKFVEQLQAEGVFAKLVNSSGRAFHSKYIADSGNIMRNYLQQIIPEPKTRSSKWISSSIPQCDWDSSLAQTSSAAYHVNNSLNPVLFYEALARVPEHALVLEIAPHSLLQAILKRTLGPGATILGLTNRSAPRNDVHFLSAIGKIYSAGLNPNVAVLYEKIEFPVPVGTTMISKMIQWDHSAAWDVPHFTKFLDGVRGKSTEVRGIDLHTEGQIHFPAMGYIFLVWETLAQMLGTVFQKLPVVFENVAFHGGILLEKSSSIKFQINILRGSGSFEVLHETSMYCSGRIQVPEHLQMEFSQLNSYAFVKYEMSDERIGSMETQGPPGKVVWNNHWVSFLETLAQFHVTGQNACHPLYPTYIQKLVIDPSTSITKTQESNYNHPPVSVYKYKNLNILKSIGVEVRGLQFQTCSIIPTKSLQTETTIVDQNNIYGVADLNAKVTMAVDSRQLTAAEAQLYTIAYYALIVRGELRPGDSILIHSGSSGLGQAGISVALSMNCDVFTTVESQEELQFLKHKFPTLKDEKLCFQTSFEENILEGSNGQGVNVVLSSYRGQLQPFLRCVSRHGRFIQVGGMDNNDKMGMAVFLNNVAFHGINPDSVFNHKDFKSIVDLVKNRTCSRVV